MKNIAYILVFLLISISNTNNSFAQCPPGYYGPFSTNVNLCGNNCPVVVEWCCDGGVGTTVLPAIYIKSIQFMTNPQYCFCLQWLSRVPPLSAIPAIDMKKVMEEILRSNNECLDDIYSNITECSNGSQLQIQVTNGGCYEYVQTLEFTGYRLCSSPTDYTQCKTFYKICRELINGEWKLKIELESQTAPAFICTEECMPFCDFTY